MQFNPSIRHPSFQTPTTVSKATDGSPTSWVGPTKAADFFSSAFGIGRQFLRFSAIVSLAASSPCRRPLPFYLADEGIRTLLSISRVIARSKVQETGVVYGDLGPPGGVHEENVNETACRGGQKRERECARAGGGGGERETIIDKQGVCERARGGGGGGGGRRGGRKGGGTFDELAEPVFLFAPGLAATALARLV